MSQDFARAAKLFQQSCDKKIMSGCVGLGRLAVAGTGVPRDEARAATLFRQACDDYRADERGVGCFLLSDLHATGKGVPQDLYRAANLKRIACDEGYQPACPPRQGGP